MRNKTKFMMSLAPEIMQRLKPYMERGGMNLQALIRAKIIPEWEAWMSDGGKQLEERAYGRGYQAHKRKVERESNGRSRKVRSN